MTATQKINLAAFDIFMLLILFCAPTRFWIFVFKTETRLTLCNSAPAYSIDASQKGKQNV
jgi:hypothetical protein